MMIMMSLTFLALKKGNHDDCKYWDLTEILAIILPSFLWLLFVFDGALVVLPWHNYSNLKAGVAESWLGQFLTWGRLLMLHRFSLSLSNCCPVFISKILPTQVISNAANLLKTQWFKNSSIDYMTPQISGPKPNVLKWNIFVNFRLFMLLCLHNFHWLWNSQ